MRFSGSRLKRIHKKIAIFGFAFKKDTNDTRETPAITVCQDLLEEQAKLAIYDPKVPEETVRRDLRPYPSELITITQTPYEAAEEAHAIVILTEWDEFVALDYGKIFKNMQQPAFVFDGRNILDLKHLRTIGFEAYGIGKPRA